MTHDMPPGSDQSDNKQTDDEQINSELSADNQTDNAKTNLGSSIADESILIGAKVERLTELTLLGFSTYTILLPAILREVAVTLPKQTVMSVSWNYVDGACIFISSIALFFKKTPSPKEDKAKAFASIISSSQLIALTIIGLGTAAFWISIAVGLLLSVCDTANAFRCKYDSKYWQKVKNEREQFYNTEITSLRDEIQQIKQVGSAKEPNNKLEDTIKSFLINRKTNRLNELESEKDKNSNAKMSCLNKEIRGKLVNNVFWAATLTGLLLIATPSLQIIGLALIGLALLLLVVQHNYDKIDDFAFGENTNETSPTIH